MLHVSDASRKHIASSDRQLGKDVYQRGLYLLLYTIYDGDRNNREKKT